MKTVLDFSLVPLDKWVDLFEAVDTETNIVGAWQSVHKFAKTQIKEQSDFDKDIAEACVDYFDAAHDTDKYRKLSLLLEQRKAAVSPKADKEVNEDTEVRSTVDLSDIPF